MYRMMLTCPFTEIHACILFPRANVLRIVSVLWLYEELGKVVCLSDQSNTCVAETTMMHPRMLPVPTC